MGDESQGDTSDIEGVPMKYRIKGDQSTAYSNDESELGGIVLGFVHAGATEVLIAIAPDDDIPLVNLEAGA